MSMNDVRNDPGHRKGGCWLGRIASSVVHCKIPVAVVSVRFSQCGGDTRIVSGSIPVATNHIGSDLEWVAKTWNTGRTGRL